MLYLVMKVDRKAATRKVALAAFDEREVADAYAKKYSLPDGNHYLEIISRWDIKSYTEACQYAMDLNGFSVPPRYVGTDSGFHVSPQFDVIQCLQIGDPVSYSIGTDSYSCGHVIHISESGKTVTVTDKYGMEYKYRRRKNSGCWVRDGVYYLFKGHRDYRDPNF